MVICSSSKWPHTMDGAGLRWGRRVGPIGKRVIWFEKKKQFETSAPYLTLPLGRELLAYNNRAPKFVCQKNELMIEIGADNELNGVDLR